MISLSWASELFFLPTEPGQDPRHVGTIEPMWTLLDRAAGRQRADRIRMLSARGAGEYSAGIKQVRDRMADVRYWHKADIPNSAANVRFWE